MFNGISLAYAPPFWVVVAFLANGCGWLAAMGAAVALCGFEILPTAPFFVAFLHIFTIGFMLFVIFGSLSQMLPVLAGVKLPAPAAVATITLACLNLGLVAFVAGFCGFDGWIFAGIFAGASPFIIAAILLGAGCGVFALSSLFALRGVAKITASIAFLGGALVAFVVLAAAGAAMLGDYGGAWALPHGALRAAHIFVGAFGGVFALVVGVCLQVLPMFYVATAFRAGFYARFVPLALAVVAAGVVALFFEVAQIRIWAHAEWIFAALKVVVAALCIALAAAALWRLRGRKRKAPDDNLPFFYAAFGALAAFGVLILAGVAAEIVAGGAEGEILRGASGAISTTAPAVSAAVSTSTAPAASTASAAQILPALHVIAQSLAHAAFALLFAGFLCGLIFAMFYKICPFLAWFHLSFLGVMNLPNIKQIVPARLIRAHFALFALTLAAAVANAVFTHAFLQLALGAGLGAQGVCGVCGALMSYACYRRHKNAPKFEFNMSFETNLK